MSNLKGSVESAKTAWEYCKSIFSLLKQKKFWSATVEAYNLSRDAYRKYLKGRYVTVKGRSIPLTAVLIAALVVLYCFASSDGAKNSDLEKALIEANTYDNDGLRVYDLRKCNYAACGYIENSSDKNFELVRIKIVFFTQTGEAVAEGLADALEVAPRTRSEFNIPCSEEFAYFKLDDVQINPDIEEEEKAKIKQQNTEDK